MSSAPAVFESFNARLLSLEEVGQTFVSSPFLPAIASPNHTAVLGPRGSGKTTLLKMLTLPALLRWPDPSRDELLEKMNFLAVYVPSSLTWNADYRGFSGKQMSAEASDLISVSLFRHNVLFALLDTWREAARPTLNHNKAFAPFFLPIEATAEADLVRKLALHWELEVEISTVGGLKAAISGRIRLLQRLSVTAAHLGIGLDQLLAEHKFLSAHFLDDFSSFADFLQDAYEFRLKLALCFDEVEIAPDAIANSILKMPRSIDQRFFVKFSAAPYVGVAATLKEASIPTQRQDYDFVLLSSFSPKETRGFSEALFGAISEKYKVYQPSERILGASLIDDASKEVTTFPVDRYGAKGAHQKRFNSLFEHDPTFRAYVTPRNINIDDLSEGSENQRAALIRKIIWPVLIREEFLFRQEGTKQQARQKRRFRSTDRVADIYTGAGSLFAICEGNPRRIIGLIEPMIKSYHDRSLAQKPGAVQRSLQKELIEEMIAAYFALVSTVPISGDIAGINSLVDVISRVGNYFKDSVLGVEFNPDPVLSFIIDEKLPPLLRELIGRGINIGAFVIADVSKAVNVPYRLGEIVGLKARLSNIFAPHFKLPLAGGRTVNLSTILERRPRAGLQPLLQLFGEKI